MQKADITDTDQGAAIAESKYEQEIAEIRAELESGLFPRKVKGNQGK